METPADPRGDSGVYTPPKAETDGKTVSELFDEVSRLADRVLEVALKKELKKVAAAGQAKLKSL